MMRLWPSIAISSILLAIPCLAEQRPAGPKKMPGHGPGVGAFERLSKMPPAQRQQVLEKLSPERKARVESRLEEYNNLPPAEKQRLHEQYESFQQLPPEKQDAVRKLYQKFNVLPEERRATVRQEFQQL